MNKYRLLVNGNSIAIVLDSNCWDSIDLPTAKAKAFEKAMSIANTSGSVVTVTMGDHPALPFLTVYPAIAPTSEVVRPLLLPIDTCAIDDLTDHCNGDRECLVSIDCPSFGAEEVMRSEAQIALATELTQVDRPSLPYLSLECRRSLATYALKHHTAINLHPWGTTGDRLTQDPDHSVRLWFRLTW